MRSWGVPSVATATAAALAVLTGCGSGDRPADDRPSSDAAEAPRLLRAGDLPEGFPLEEVPVVEGRVVRTETGARAGAPPGKATWAVALERREDAEECFDIAVGALRQAGLRETRSYEMGSSRQALMRSAHYDVMVSAMAISGRCTLWYAVGPDGLRVAG